MAEIIVPQMMMTTFLLVAASVAAAAYHATPTQLTGRRALLRLDVTPALPEEGNTTARTLQVGESESLDELGPVVVTESGALRQIDNWQEMSDEEKEMTQRLIAKRNAARLKKLRGGSMATAMTRGTFSYNGFQCAYRHKPAAAGFEEAPPLLLIHPVGIGLASWFWDKFADEYEGGEVFVPDLIGCGQSDAWDPAERGLFVPLDWVRSLEALWREHIRRPMVVMSQGGLAPVAVRLAARETDNWRGGLAVRGLILASPPEWKSMAEGYGEEEVAKNFRQLSTVLGGAGPLPTFAYRTLCARGFVQFFSDLFLFSDKADEAFLEACASTARPERRWPVLAFNAGMVATNGLDVELRALEQPTVVLYGTQGGKPNAESQAEYEGLMRDCRVQPIPQACNVLPWEATSASVAAVASLVESVADTRS